MSTLKKRVEKLEQVNDPRKPLTWVDNMRALERGERAEEFCRKHEKPRPGKCTWGELIKQMKEEGAKREHIEKPAG